MPWQEPLSALMLRSTYVRLALHLFGKVRSRDMEWWMKRRQLPSDLIRRVRHFENQRWSAMGGQDDMEMVKNLPKGIRRDIKRYLCFDLIKKDDVILDNICDHVTYFVYSNGEKIIREGDPVHRIMFIVIWLGKANPVAKSRDRCNKHLGTRELLRDELL
ncbi:ion channel, cNMP-binding protein [Artemisia annua]|uniref:Ion channel, cNMP-binding protein n=1 Tax=Artemisia annua TaxID=35608 RepID=A0A2U1LSM8_ARTAN|nr:ion channel, cNMP-binding protein [Artemisia annua]